MNGIFGLRRNDSRHDAAAARDADRTDKTTDVTHPVVFYVNESGDVLPEVHFETDDTDALLSDARGHMSMTSLLILVCVLCGRLTH